MKVYCIIGDERSFRSKSPAMFSTILKRVGIKGIYVPFSVESQNIGKVLQSLRVLNISGANVTVPYKEAIMPHLDTLSEGATIIGAVNTIVCNDNMFKGYNTNAIGFMDALEDANFDATGKKALVFGTGGAAKAVVFILNWLRAESIIVVGRNTAKSKEIANRFQGETRVLESLPENPIPVDIVVNATAISNADDAPEFADLVNRIDVSGCQLVVDLNYGNNQLLWRHFAEERNTPFINGLTTLAYQAKRTFALWTGMQVEYREFLRALKEESEL